MSTDGRTKDYAEGERPPPGNAFIEVVRGAPDGAFPLERASTVIGRDPECDARFAVHGVSRRHARIMRDADGALRVVDLGSHNGTFLNGRKVQTGVLRGGDEIRVGPVVVRLRFVGESDGPQNTGNAAALDALRPREREVAMLVAEGLTNAEIGARLGISTGTVGRHLANSYERLGIHSRAALAALATRATSGPP
ncbi:MAG: FHA domain-containing protein [Myxococcota bacterium]